MLPKKYKNDRRKKKRRHHRGHEAHEGGKRILPLLRANACNRAHGPHSGDAVNKISSSLRGENAFEKTGEKRRGCSREESNLHGFPHTVLSRTRLPFRHVSVPQSSQQVGVGECARFAKEKQLANWRAKWRLKSKIRAAKLTISPQRTRSPSLLWRIFLRSCPALIAIRFFDSLLNQHFRNVRLIHRSLHRSFFTC